MTYPWKPLSKPFDKAPDQHDILVIGSGYGGGVAASRLARAGRRVSLLERGQEIAPGAYPRSGSQIAQHTQINRSHNPDRLGKADALFDLRVGDDVNVLVGCGLGGTSLINANVAIAPDPRVFETWPAPFCDDADLLSDHFDRARKMLGSTPYPSHKTLPKLDALEHSAKAMNAPFDRPDINVTFEDGPNAAGIWQAACTDCGDCVSGCNYGAKNTVLMNYLPDAHAHGARIYTGARVSHLRRSDNGWEVFVAQNDGQRRLQAKMVILAAGTLGSTEILLKSAGKGLPLSPRLGERFSGNGDVYAFGYNANIPQPDGSPAPLYCVGAGPNDTLSVSTDAAHKPGPCIAGMIDLRDPDKPVTQGILIEEGVMPGGFAAGYASVFPAMSTLMGDPMRFGDTARRLQDMADLAAGVSRDSGALASTAYDGPVSRTMPYLIMSHDAAEGALVLSPETGNVTVSWDDAGLDPAMIRDAKTIRTACDAIQAEYLPMPLWQEAFGHRLISVHPLGGCAMGQDADHGVVNTDCQVFDGAGGVHDGLFVCDGAVIPGAVGVNPHLTITAVAERAVERLAQARGWRIDGSDAAIQPPAKSAAQPTFDPIATLDDAIGLAQQLKDTIVRGTKPDFQIRIALGKIWKNLTQKLNDALSDEDKTQRPLPQKSDFTAFLKAENRLHTLAVPLLDQWLDALVPIRDALVANDPGAALDLFHRHFGDPSPAGWFDEVMTGRLSKTGLEDDPQISDPHQVAGHGAPNCTFQGHIEAHSIHALISDPDTPAQIINGTLQCDLLGGTFTFDGAYRYLVADPTGVERWHMHYTGTLIPVDGGAPLSFTGRKTLQQREGSHWWRDLTELAVDIHAAGKLVARGLLVVGFEDLIEQAMGLTVAYRPGSLAQAYRDAYDTISGTVTGDPAQLPATVRDKALRAHLVKCGLLGLQGMKQGQTVQTIEGVYLSQTLGKMAALVLRSYGGLYSYMANFPAQAARPARRLSSVLPSPSIYHPRSEPGVRTKLTRYNGGDNGPVILAGGFGTKASSMALPTVQENIVEALVKAGFDVWLFDYRGSGDLEASLHPFTLDDVALRDWPAAIDTVCRVSQSNSVQALVHCVGSMTLFMALLAGEKRVRSVIASQLATHAITNWYNYAKADSHIAEALINGAPPDLRGLIEALPLGPALSHIAATGLDVLDPRSPSPHFASPALDQAIDGLLWGVPAFAPTRCNSPTCHRITAIFGPSYNHDQLNQATHDTIADLFGPLSTTPFAQIADIYRRGHVFSQPGGPDYMQKYARLRLPIHLFSGALNQEMLPEATLRTYNWLRSVNDDHAGLYSRHVYQGYGHMDCFIGQNAHRDIFPDIVARLKNPAKTG